MDVFHLLVATLIGAAPIVCGTPVESTAGGYGSYGGGPAPSERVTRDGAALSVDTTLGDRQFTTILSRYDASTLALLSVKMHASCCGSEWSASVTKNADDTYDIETQELMEGNDVLRKSRPHLHVQPHVPITVGGYFFVPFLQHAARASQIARIDLDSAQVQYLTIEPVASPDFPDGVPHADRAERITDGRSTTLLWFNPCTFTLDAYGQPNSVATVRHALI